MFGENSPVSLTGVLGAIIAWCAASYFVLGPMIADRHVALKTDWGKMCVNQVRAKAAAEAPVQTPVIRPDCNLFAQFLPQMREVCRKHGNPSFNVPFGDQIAQIQRRKNEMVKLRLRMIGAYAPARCNCAKNVATRNINASDWAWYAGSLRTVEMDGVTNVMASMKRALNSPECSMKG